jgi:hypothetical protein
MIIQYYGYNVSINEILHHAGVGYSLSYCRFLESFAPARIPNSGNQLCRYSDNVGFLLNLYNLTFTEFIVPEQPEETRWQAYWTKIKETIQNDIPVKTTVDPYSLPYLRRIWNISDNTTHGSHVIIIVGYNESNQSVCYNDPAAAFWDDEINGTYTYIDLGVFKGAMENNTGMKYRLGIVELQDDFSPTSPQYRFDMVYSRNIRKMMGRRGAYFNNFIHPWTTFLGINAVKGFKRDIQIGLTYRPLTIYQLRKIDYWELEYLINKICFEKHNASEYLLENENLFLTCEYVGRLLQEESECWSNVTNLVLQVNEIGRNNTFLKTWILSRPILMEIIQELDIIISIEERIISV